MSLECWLDFGVYTICVQFEVSYACMVFHNLNNSWRYSCNFGELSNTCKKQSS